MKLSHRIGLGVIVAAITLVGVAGSAEAQKRMPNGSPTTTISAAGRA